MGSLLILIASLKECKRERTTHRIGKPNRGKIDSEKKRNLELNTAAIQNNFEGDNESCIYLNDVYWGRDCKLVKGEDEIF